MALSAAPSAFLAPVASNPVALMFGLTRGVSLDGSGFMFRAAACRCAVWLFSTTLLWVSRNFRLRSTGVGQIIRRFLTVDRRELGSVPAALALKLAAERLKVVGLGAQEPYRYCRGCPWQTRSFRPATSGSNSAAKRSGDGVVLPEPRYCVPASTASPRLARAADWRLALA
jgi:hypothetical protein